MWPSSSAGSWFAGKAITRFTPGVCADAPAATTAVHAKPATRASVRFNQRFMTSSPAGQPARALENSRRGRATAGRRERFAGKARPCPDRPPLHGSCDMNSGTILGIVILVLGIVWLAFGLHAADAPLERLSDAFTGRYTNDTQWALIGGAVIAAAGAALAIGSAVRR